MPTIKPEFFSYDMTRAILEGRKTAARRVIKCSGHKVEDLLLPDPLRGSRYAFSALNCRTEKKEGVTLVPRHLPGNIIYIRENFAMSSSLSGVSDTDGPIYMADYSPQELKVLKEKGFRWKPCFHMAMDQSRLFLRVKAAWPERLRNITEEQAKAEGISEYSIGEGEIGFATSPDCNAFHDTATSAFADLWNSRFPSPDYPLYGWLANPMVWVYEFEVISREEALGERSTT